jgi:hypothetical protein
MVRIIAGWALALILLEPSPAAAQEWRCAPIRHGDSAAAMALRLTGDARNRVAPWFQIVDPATQTFVPKAGYDRIRPGWRACIAGTSLAPAPPHVSGESTLGWLDATLATLVNLAREADANVVLWLGLVIAITLVSSSIGEYVDAKKAVPDAIRRFAEEFVREFERPLLLPDERRRAVRARLRVNVSRRRLEVLLAPAAGRRYPNLSDHRTNVEYDIRRVTQRLRGPAVVGDALYAQGPWVVVPFELPENSRQAGVK